MARIYLISPPYHGVYRKINSKNFGVLQPPLGLAYIASYLKSRKHYVKIFDSSFSLDVFKDIKNQVHEFSPDFVVLTATTPQIDFAFKIAEYIKGMAPAIKIILGGFHVSALPKESISHPDIDIIVCGEGEITVSEIVEGEEINRIKGVCFREGPEIKINPSRLLIEDLDSLPFPLWEQLPVKSYFYFPEKTVGVISGRGCLYNCSFCASAVINQHRYRTRSPGNFVAEIEWLGKNFGTKHLFFIDETFTSQPQRTEEICRLILKKKLLFKWTCDTRADCLTKGMLKLMKLSGCHTIRIGVESADDQVLQATGKKITLGQVERAISWARELGIKTTAYFLLGLPYETEISLAKTLNFAKKLKTDLAHFTMLVPLPGTRIWEIVKEGKILRSTAKDWSQYVRYDQAIVESDHLSTTKLFQFHRQMIRSYYLSPGYIFRRLSGIKSFKELYELSKGGGALAKMVFQKTCR